MWIKGKTLCNLFIVFSIPEWDFEVKFKSYGYGIKTVSQADALFESSFCFIMGAIRWCINHGTFSNVGIMATGGFCIKPRMGNIVSVYLSLLLASTACLTKKY